MADAVPLRVKFPSQKEDVAKAAWAQFKQTVAPFPEWLAEPTFHVDFAGDVPAIATSWLDLDSTGQISRATISLRNGFFGLDRERQALTLLHEAIHLLELNTHFPERIKKGDEITNQFKWHKGKTPSERHCEQHQATLARYLYFFPEEVFAELYLIKHYPDQAGARVAFYVENCVENWTSSEHTKGVAPLEVYAHVYYWLRNKLGLQIAGGTEAEVGFIERILELQDMIGLSEEGHELLELGERLLVVGLDPPSIDESAAEALLQRVIAAKCLTSGTPDSLS